MIQDRYKEAIINEMLETTTYDDSLNTLMLKLMLTKKLKNV